MDCLKGLLTLSLMCLSEGQQEATLGHNVVLQCQIRKGEVIQVLKWIRPDLKSDGYVYFYRNKRSYKHYQHPSFAGRAELADPEMKDGDASLILTDVNLNDTGRYECHVSVRDTGHSKRTTLGISLFIDLKVTDSGHTHESERENSTRENTIGDVQYVNDVSNVSVVGVVVFVVVAAVAAMILWRVTRPRWPSAKAGHHQPVPNVYSEPADVTQTGFFSVQ